MNSRYAIHCAGYDCYRSAVAGNGVYASEVRLRAIERGWWYDAKHDHWFCPACSAKRAKEADHAKAAD